MKILYLAAILSIFLFLVFGPRPKPQAESALENSVVFGCYSAPGQDSILLDETGLTIVAQEFGPIDYRVLPQKQRYDLDLPSCPKVSQSDGKLIYVSAEKGGMCWFELYNTAGGAFSLEMSDLDAAGFRVLGPYGFVKFARNPEAFCSVE